jgi:hypothetical protein
MTELKTEDREIIVSRRHILIAIPNLGLILGKFEIVLSLDSSFKSK